MIKKIAFIGATGNLSPNVYREMLGKGLSVKALVRNSDKELQRVSFPKEMEIVKADLSNVDSLLKAFEGEDAVYMNLSTKYPNAPFQPELDGVRNVIEAAKKTNVKRIFQISAIPAIHPETTKGKKIYVNEIRIKGHQLIRESGIPHTFFHCSWFMESLDVLMRKGNKVQGFKPVNYPMYWIAGKDYARMVVNAILKSPNIETDYVMQGNEALTMKEAIHRYAKSFTPPLKIQIAPVWLLKMMGWFNRELKLFAEFAAYFEHYEEQFFAESTWKALGEPQFSIETFNKEKI